MKVRPARGLAGGSGEDNREPGMPRIGTKYSPERHPRERGAKRRKSLARWLTAAVGLLSSQVLAVPAAVAQSATGANAPAQVSDSPARAAPPTPAAALDSAHAASRVNEASPAAAPDRPEIESRPLGTPNGALSARPAASAERRPSSADPQLASRNSEVAGNLVGAGRPTGGSSTGGLLGAIDPRRNDFTRVLGALAAVVGLILLTRTLMVRYLPNWIGGPGKGERPSGVVEILARYPLARGQQLVVLRFARRVLLLHQAGTACRTLTEMSDPNEVAGLLSRLEAGAGERAAGKFRAALEAFESEHDVALARQSRAGAAVAAETEIIDLTRTHLRPFGNLMLPGRRAAR